MLSLKLRRAASNVLSRKPSTVAEVLAPFNQMREQLIDLARAKDEQITTAKARIEELRLQVQRDSQEGQTAMLAADRINWMLHNPTT